MKNHFLKILLFSISVFQLEIISFTQQNEKIWFDGLGRSYFSRDNVVSNGDTISPNNMSGGYNLIDLNVHVNPIPNIEVFGQVRVQNQFGGFFGSGTQIDVRQLTARGTFKNKIKFSEKETVNNVQKKSFVGSFLGSLIVLLLIITPS